MLGYVVYNKKANINDLPMQCFTPPPFIQDNFNDWARKPLL